MTAVSDLRRQAVNRMAVGELEIQGRDLILFLDNREIRRFTLPHPPRSDGAVFFNRFGICSGGALRIRLSRVYLVRIAPISGKISLETP